MMDLPSYEVMLDRLRRFLAEQGLSQEFCWIWRDSIRVPRRQTATSAIYVHTSGLTHLDTLAEARYEQGLRRGLGISVEVPFVVGDTPCCYIWLPADSIDADYRMSNGLKISVAAPIRHARSVSSRIAWKLLSCVTRSPMDFWLAEIPWQKDAVAIMPHEVPS